MLARQLCVLDDKTDSKSKWVKKLIVWLYCPNYLSSLFCEDFDPWCFAAVGLSPSKKICVICLIESPLKMMKNAFYFILKAFFVLKIFKFLSRLFGHVGKTAWLKR